MFITPAYAAPAQQSPNVLVTLLPMLLVFAVVLFLGNRSQQKRAAAYKKTIESIKKGDKVVTNSGMIGDIARIKENEFILEIADGIQITVLKSAVASLYKGDVSAVTADDVTPSSQKATGAHHRAKQKRK
ncbi:MAG: preprotein translocase subunit YajC [Holosporales bacterium]|jgi:preprotein translocase subunit YajC|nr:preprotein translocase subunit YajC [Holosporales bacterium]